MGALPALSLDGHQYYIVAYDYDNNFIKAQEVSDLKDGWDDSGDCAKDIWQNGGEQTQTYRC